MIVTGIFVEYQRLHNTSHVRFTFAIIAWLSSLSVYLYGPFVLCFAGDSIPAVWSSSLCTETPNHTKTSCWSTSTSRPRKIQVRLVSWSPYFSSYSVQKCPVYGFILLKNFDCLIIISDIWWTNLKISLVSYLPFNVYWTTPDLVCPFFPIMTFILWTFSHILCVGLHMLLNVSVYRRRAVALIPIPELCW